MPFAREKARRNRRYQSCCHNTRCTETEREEKAHPRDSSGAAEDETRVQDAFGHQGSQGAIDNVIKKILKGCVMSGKIQQPCHLRAVHSVVVVRLLLLRLLVAAFARTKLPAQIERSTPSAKSNLQRNYFYHCTGASQVQGHTGNATQGGKAPYKT